MRPIDADALIDKMNALKIPYRADINIVILNAPTIEPKRGRWEITDAYPHNVYCSECFTRFAQTHWTVWEDGSLPRKYCPNCGARMENK